MGKSIPNHIAVYYNDLNKKVTAFNLWNNGINIFKKSLLWQDWDRIKNFDLEKNHQEVIQYVENHMFIEYVRCITCFENYLKGKLILNNYLVHHAANEEVYSHSESLMRLVFAWRGL